MSFPFPFLYPFLLRQDFVNCKPEAGAVRAFRLEGFKCFIYINHQGNGQEAGAIDFYSVYNILQHSDNVL